MKFNFIALNACITAICLLVMACNSDQNNGAETKVPIDQKKQGQELLSDLYNSAHSGHLDSMDILCANSPGYNNEEWDEINHCRWALEKRVLARIPEYAKRESDQLSLQIDNGQWMMLEHERSDAAATQYFQFRKYLSQSHYFLISQRLSNACPKQWFIDAKSGERLFFPGNIWQHHNRDMFITGPEDQSNCPNEIHLIHFDKSGKIKFDLLDLKNRLLAVKWDNRSAILKTQGKDGPEYRNWVLP